MGIGKIAKLSAGLSLALALATPSFAQAQAQGASEASEQDYAAEFDAVFGTEVREPRNFNPTYDTPFERQIAALADGAEGRIGVYAIDLASGREVGVLQDQWFPMASTSKVAIAAAYLAGVDQGKWSLTSEWRLPRRGGGYVAANELLRLMIAKSCNDCTDALLNAVGGPSAVNAWMREAGIEDFRLSRNIATLIREDGRIDPAFMVDMDDSATPRAMGQLLAGIYQGRWLTPSSRQVLMNAMLSTTTGKNRMPAALPAHANLAHKTGTLARTASDIGIFMTPDGRPIAAAIYVTGQSPSMQHENGDRSAKLRARSNRDSRIAAITGALYRGFGVRQAAEDGRAAGRNASAASAF